METNNYKSQAVDTLKAAKKWILLLLPGVIFYFVLSNLTFVIGTQFQNPDAQISKLTYQLEWWKLEKQQRDLK